MMNTMVAGETLTDLVAARVGVGRAMTFDQFEARAIDPKSRTRPSRGVLWKIAKGKPIMLNPELVSAVAAGLGLDRNRVALAAGRQYLGLDAGDPAPGAHGPDVTVTLAYPRGEDVEDSPRANAKLRQILDELSDDDSNTQ